jgi:hypothetical protein
MSATIGAFRAIMSRFVTAGGLVGGSVERAA